jgi:hypothetical protein
MTRSGVFAGETSILKEITLRASRGNLSDSICCLGQLLSYVRFFPCQQREVYTHVSTMHGHANILTSMNPITFLYDGRTTLSSYEVHFALVLVADGIQMHVRRLKKEMFLCF